MENLIEPLLLTIDRVPLNQRASIIIVETFSQVPNRQS